MAGAIASWREVARAFGGALEIGEAYGDRAYLRIPVQVEGAALVVTLTGVHDGDPLLDGMRVKTHITGDAPGSRGLSLRLDAAGYASALGSLLGRRPDPLGLGPLDRRYAARASDVGFARAWLDDPETCRRLAELNASYHAGGYDVRLSDGRLELVRSGAERDPERLIGALHAAARVCARGRLMLADWRRLAAELGGRAIAPSGTWGIDGVARIDQLGHVDRTGDAHIDSVLAAVRAWRRRGLFTRAVCPRGREPADDVDEWALVATGAPRRERLALPRGYQTIPAGSAGGLAAPRGWPCALAARRPDHGLRQIAEQRWNGLLDVRPAAVLSTASEVSVWLPGHELDPHRLRGAITLACELATVRDPSAGPYR